MCSLIITVRILTQNHLHKVFYNKKILNYTFKPFLNFGISYTATLLACETHMISHKAKLTFIILTRIHTTFNHLFSPVDTHKLEKLEMAHFRLYHIRNTNIYLHKKKRRQIYIYTQKKKTTYKINNPNESKLALNTQK